jgi:hypothetical protein
MLIAALGRSVGAGGFGATKKQNKISDTPMTDCQRIARLS